MNTYIDETNAELDEHETKTQRLRGNMSQDVEDGETAREKKVRMKKEKETLQQDVVDLVKSLEVCTKYLCTHATKGFCRYVSMVRSCMHLFKC